MTLTRKIQRRFDLNNFEDTMLRKKASMAGISCSELIRDLITGYAPAEKPGKEFYDAMEEIRKIGVNINQIAKVANATGVIDEKWLRDLAARLDQGIVDLKKMVTWARPYNYSWFEDYELAVRICREEGLPDPKDDEVEMIINKYRER